MMQSASPSEAVKHFGIRAEIASENTIVEHDDLLS